MATPTKDAVRDALRSVLGHDHVRTATEADGIDGVMPTWVATVDGTERTSAAMRVAAEHGLRVVAKGSGSKLDWGAPPQGVDLVVDMSGADEVLEHAAGDLVVHAKAGTPLRRVQDTVSRAGQQLSIDHSLPSATLGGVIATGAAGPCRHLYGTVRDLLIGITVVRADGVITRSGGKVVKNVAGYDLGKLYSGSWGTLGVVTEAIFRLHPHASEHRWISVEVNDSEAITVALDTVRQSQAMPTALEIDHTVDGQTTVCAKIEGQPGATQERADVLAGAVRRAVGQAADVHGAAPSWWGQYPHGMGQDIGLRLTTHPGRVGFVLAQATDAARRCGVKLSLRGAAGSGVLEAGAPEGSDPGAVADLVSTLRTITSGPGEHTIIVRAPRIVTSTVDPWGPVPPGLLTLLRNTKSQFDPEHRLAPGRFVGGI